MATNVTDNDFDTVVLQSTIPVLVDFWAPWCGPCRSIGPVIEELAAEYAGKVLVTKMNVDENPATPGKYGIRAIPSLFVFKNGAVVSQATGASNKNSLVELISKAL